MSDFAGMEEMLQDFMTEASDLLSEVDNKLVELERAPHDKRLLDDIFRGFHTIKGGSSFLQAEDMVNLCHLTENLFDHLRHDQLFLDPELMDLIMSATQEVRRMFDDLAATTMPPAAPANLLDALRAAIAGETAVPASPVLAQPPAGSGEPEWGKLHAAITGSTGETEPVQRQEPNLSANLSVVPAAPPLVVLPVAPTTSGHPQGRRASDQPAGMAGGGRRADERAAQKENTIRVDTLRLDQVLNLSGEIGLTKNRLNSLRADILAGKRDQETLHALDQAVSQLDLLVSDLQSSVMKTRMQPIGRLFQKYPRIARDLARNLGKEVDLVLAGEGTELDKTMIEDLADPLIHLIRNAVDHGIESAAERVALGKPENGVIRLEARQEGDHIVLIIADDGRGMSPEIIRAKAVEKGLLTEEEANTLDERQSLNLVLLPGFSTKAEVSDVSGRGVGMDVVKTNIQKLNGKIEIRSEPGKGSVFIISLPLTLAILPVLLVLLDGQPFALPLSMVREILTIREEEVREVGGRQTLVVRGEVLPVISLTRLLGWQLKSRHGYGVLMHAAEKSFILGVDNFAGRDDAVIKSLDDFRPEGVAGVTTLANGQIVLILDMKELLTAESGHARLSLRRAA